MATTTNYGWTTPDDTDLVKNGASAIRSLGTSVDTAVWNAGYTAGKNKIINGDFSINQRNLDGTGITATGYGFDRWRFIAGGATGSTTYTKQTFTAGAAPVAGYEAANYARLVSTGQSNTTSSSVLQQRIEDVRTFAGQTITISFWAKAASSTPKIAVELVQYFGTGGSPSADVNTYAGQATLSTSWARYSLTIAIPSISGKTIGSDNNSYFGLNLWASAGTDFNSRTGSLGIQSNTFDFWGVQVEAGSTATPFQTATGTKQGELAACQRYYWRTNATNNYSMMVNAAFAYSSTVAGANVQFPVTMRTNISAIDFSTLQFTRYDDTAYALSAITWNSSTASPTGVFMYGTVSGATAGNVGRITAANSTNGYLGFSAEL